MAEKGLNKGLGGKEVLWKKRGHCNDKNKYKSKLANIKKL